MTRAVISPHEDRRSLDLRDMLRQARMGIEIVREGGIGLASLVAFAFCLGLVAIGGVVVVAGGGA